MKRRLRAPSPALVISLIALFIALGGTSYAAINALPKNSVGARQLKKNAVTTKKIKNGAVTAGKINPAGLTVPSATHATTAASATSATNATNATTAANAANLGGLSAASYLPNAVLPSGKTEVGAWGDYDTATAGGAGFFSVNSFQHPIPAVLDPAHAIYVAGASATHCSGVGRADRGYLCVYQSALLNASTLGPQKITGGAGASPNGFVVLIDPAAAGVTFITGTYAVTAP